MTIKISVAPFQVSHPSFVPAGTIVTIQPDSGATATVEYTKGSAADIQNNVAAWAAWAKGTVSTATQDIVGHTGFIRVTALGGNVAVAINKTPVAAEVAALTSQDWGAPVQVSTDPFGNILGLLGSSGIIPGTEQSAHPNAITKYGKKMLDLSRADLDVQTTGIAIPANVEDQWSYDYARHGNTTRKVTINAALGTVKFRNLSIVQDTAPDIDKAFAFTVYLPNIPNEFLGTGNTPSISVRLSQHATGGAGPSETWIFDATFIRQGPNILKMRMLDDKSPDTSTPGTGNLPTGCVHVGSNPLVWTNPILYIEINFTNMNGWTVYLDEFRRATKVLTRVTSGFDAAGWTATDDAFITVAAPLFAQYGYRSYVTIAGIDVPFSGGQDWNRRITLRDKWGWDVVPHTESHGGTTAGASRTITSISRTSNIVTVGMAAHNLTVGSTVKLSYRATGAIVNQELVAVQKCTVTSPTQMTFRCAGADFAAGTETGVFTARSFMSEVIDSDTPENRAICDHEVGDIVRYMRGAGFGPACGFLPYPNNSVPHLVPLKAVCDAVGVKLGRGYRGGYAPRDDRGYDNPLHMGSFELGSQGGGLGTATRLSVARAKLKGAIDRGDDIHFYSHYMIDERVFIAQGLQVDLEYPPGYVTPGGFTNPVPAGFNAATGGGGAWYRGQHEVLLQDIKAYESAGQCVYMVPSVLVAATGMK